MKFPIYKQLDAMDCGPTCLRMVAKYYGRSISLDYLRNKTQYGKEGVSMLGLNENVKLHAKQNQLYSRSRLGKCIGGVPETVDRSPHFISNNKCEKIR